MKNKDAFVDAAADALREIRRARLLGWGPYHSAHEGIAVLLEEVDELKTHVWTNQKKRDVQAMRAEAIQVAAVALHFAVLCADEKWGRR